MAADLDADHMSNGTEQEHIGKQRKDDRDARARESFLLSMTMAVRVGL